MTNEMKPVRVRFAPSPTGRLHMGGARTALYDYLIAKKTGGQFILRIEDTDRTRYVPTAEQEIIDGLHWLGIDWDEGPDKGGPFGPYRQTERKEIYLKVAEELVDKGYAYYCFCTPERLEEMRKQQAANNEFPHYDGHCRDIPLEEAKRRVAAGEPHVIRFKTPHEGTTVVHDLLRGDISIDNKQLEDAILVKTDGWALYHLAAMVDDHLMGITHVIRSSEWLPSLPLHHMIYQALGWDEPEWVHLSVLLSPSGKGKLSKRESEELLKQGYAVFVTDFADLGYIPEAVTNWIAQMGASFEGDDDFFTMKELEDKFSFDHLNPAPAAMNFQKLDHFNGAHIRSLTREDLAERLLPFFKKAGIDTDYEGVYKVTPCIQERMVRLTDGPEIARWMFTEDIPPVMDQLMQKKLEISDCIKIAEMAYDVISGLPSLDAETAEQPLRDLVAESGYKAGQVFGLIRGAISGQKVTPPLFDCMVVIGKEKVLERLSAAIEFLKANNA